MKVIIDAIKFDHVDVSTREGKDFLYSSLVIVEYTVLTPTQILSGNTTTAFNNTFNISELEASILKELRL